MKQGQSSHPERLSRSTHPVAACNSPQPLRNEATSHRGQPIINPGEVDILVVEDSAIQAEILRRTLVKEGYQVAVAGNGANALAMIRKKKPALIISDIVMPVMDGYEMCHEIKHDEGIKDIPVILLTGLSDTRDVIKGLDARADSYIIKPYDNQLLLARIAAILSRPSCVAELPAGEPLEIEYGGEVHVVTSGRREILNFLISTYENAVHQNRQLIQAQTNLKALNQELDLKLTQLQESEERYSVLVQMIPDIVYRIDAEGRFIFVNDAVKRLGYQPESLIGKHFSEIILPADVEGVSRAHVLPRFAGKVTGPDHAPKLFDERRTGDRATKNLEVRLITKGQAKVQPAMLGCCGQEVVLVEVNSAGMYEVLPQTRENPHAGVQGVNKGKPLKVRHLGTVGAIRDITERKLAEAALHRSEERFRLLVQTAGNPIVLLSPDYHILEWNFEAGQVYGKSRDEVLGQNFLSLLESSEKDQVAESLQKVMSGTQEKDLETSFKHRGGSVGYLLWNFSCLLSEEQNPLGIIAVAQDLTEWKRAEEERLNAEAMAEMSGLSARVATETIDGMMDAVLIISLDGKIIQYNHGFEESFGWGREVIGDSLANYLVGVEVQKVLEEIVQGQPGTNHLKNIDCQIIDRDHKQVPVLVNATLLKGSDGTQDKVITVIRDITERKQYEEALQEKSAEMSVLYSISAALAVSINPEEIFARLLNSFSELEIFNVMKMSSLFVVDDGSLRLVPHPRHSQEFIELHRNLKVGECLCGLAAQTGEIVICQDCADDERAIMRCHDGVCHGHVFLPLKGMEEAKGVLAFTCSEQFQMDENKEKILRTISGLMRVALDNAALHEKTKALSLSDPLTGIANRRLMDIMLDKSLARSRRYGGPLSVVMADLDFFKKFNDTKGHVEGDRLLRKIAGLISGEIRQTDMVARYGGEEFLIMLPDANCENACLTAERIRRRIAEQSSITISLGVASYHKGMKNKEDLINQSDQAMYRAKQNGRNQVQVMDQNHGIQITAAPQTTDR
jgi:diguanylate cyclase (GGDEF)-like protein/PAS domain S-box-containing protein